LWPNGWMHQDATWYGGRPRPTRIVFDVNPATPRKRAHPHHPIFGRCLLWPNGWMDEYAAWYTEVDLGPGHIVLDGVPHPAKGAQQPPLFSAHVYCGHSRPSQDATWYGGRPRPTRHCVRCGPSYPQKKGTPTPPNF